MSRPTWTHKEDREKASSKTTTFWSKDERLCWVLETRHHHGPNSWRMGHLILKGSFDGVLTLAIRETPFFQDLHNADQ